MTKSPYIRSLAREHAQTAFKRWVKDMKYHDPARIFTHVPDDDPYVLKLQEGNPDLNHLLMKYEDELNNAIFELYNEFVRQAKILVHRATALPLAKKEKGNE